MKKLRYDARRKRLEPKGETEQDEAIANSSTDSTHKAKTDAKWNISDTADVQQGLQGLMEDAVTKGVALGSIPEEQEQEQKPEQGPEHYVARTH